MALRVLIVLEAGGLVPSGLVRGLIYKDYFQKSGIEVRYVNRQYTPIFQLLVSPSRFGLLLIRIGLGRLFVAANQVMTKLNERTIVHLAKQYDVVYMSKVQSYSLVKRIRENSTARLVYDFGDAIWLPQFHVPHFSDTLKLVDAVTTDNELTADYVRQFNQNCTVIPDCPQVEWFDQRRAEYRQQKNNEIIIGWIGTFSTAYNLYVVWEALEHLSVKYPNIHLRLVGVGPNDVRLPPFNKVKYSCRPRYSQPEMIEEVLGMDIGLFPLQDVEASQVRGVLKGTVYMAGEAAVVCSPVGQSLNLIKDGVNGLFACSTKEWEQQLELLITNPELRQRLTQAGLDTVRANFTVEKSFAKLHAVLTST